MPICWPKLPLIVSSWAGPAPSWSSTRPLQAIPGPCWTSSAARMPTARAIFPSAARSSEFVRVTGYLVRRADLEAKQHEKASRYSSAVLASGFMQTKPNHLHRRTRQV